MPNKNLLLCFDAFGTLFRPRTPVHQQYAEIARSLGLRGFSDEDVQLSFKNAFKQEAKRNPNYGKSNGMNAEKWWTNIIRGTFLPLVGPNTELPSDLVPMLLRRFWCEEGYILFPDVQPLLRRIRKAHSKAGHNVIVGVITNSDDRVPAILSSLGLQVGSLRFGSVTQQRTTNDGASTTDIDFSVMSYDAGHEKPDPRIFLAGEQMLATMLHSEGQPSQPIVGADEWRKIYVGDEYSKDVVGATNAGWKAVLIDRESTSPPDGLEWLAGQQPGNLLEILETTNAVGFSSLAEMAEWLQLNIVKDSDK